jgi:hypothetical protein
VGARHLGGAERGRDRGHAHRRPGDRGQRLGDVDDASAAEGDEQPAGDGVAQLGRDLADVAGADVVDGRGAARRARARRVARAAS